MERGHYEEHGLERRANSDKDKDSLRQYSNGDEPKEKKSKTFAEELDEFGRAASKLQNNKTRWPPYFATNGSAFVLDTRSGMFYESTSDFFYDPKSKLYFGNKQGAYFRYNPSSKAFDEVQKVDVQTETTAAPVLDAQSTLSITQQQGKKMAISINLKTKELPSSNPSKKSKLNTVSKQNPTTAVPVAATARVLKKHVADMDKWSERQIEKHQDAMTTHPTVIADAIVTTAKGEPICRLCRRKFPTMEKLLYHEQVSNLHKENMAKHEVAAAAANKNAAPAASSYVDRAHQRRIMYGAETTAIGSLSASDLQSVVSLGSSQSSITVAASSVRVKPEDNLGESNIGNKMLQKLGWKAGNALGRQALDVNRSEEDDSDRTPAVSQQPVVAMIKQDWERIESMASNGGKGNQMSGGIGSSRCRN